MMKIYVRLLPLAGCQKRKTNRQQQREEKHEHWLLLFCSTTLGFGEFALVSLRTSNEQ